MPMRGRSVRSSGDGLSAALRVAHPGAGYPRLRDRWHVVREAERSRGSDLRSPGGVEQVGVRSVVGALIALVCVGCSLPALPLYRVSQLLPPQRRTSESQPDAHRHESDRQRLQV